MKRSDRIWSHPAKTKLWLFNMNSDTFCKKELELWAHIVSYGPDGCDNQNWKLAEEIHRSIRQTQYYLRNLEKHTLIDRIPGWAELTGNQFKKVLRPRRIIALPWPNKRTWIRESIKENLRKLGQKHAKASYARANYRVQKIAHFQDFRIRS